MDIGPGPGRKELRVRGEYYEPRTVIPMDGIFLSRLQDTVQLDIWSLNLGSVIEHLKSDSPPEELDVAVSVSVRTSLTVLRKINDEITNFLGKIDSGEPV